MSDSDKEAPKTARKPLGLKRSVESGEVKQTFSHGRTNKVVVEVKRRKLVGKPGAQEAAAKIDPTAPPAAPAPAPVAKEEAPKPAPAKPKAPVEDVMTRQERQAQLLREAEAARMQALEDARVREKEQKQKKTVDVKTQVETKRKAETEAAAKAELAKADAEAKAAADAEKAKVAADAKPETKAAETDAPKKPTPPPARKFTPVASPKRPEPKPKPSRGKVDDRRQSGKLTVSRALNDGDGGARARSLAALKRARDKEKRAHMKGQPRAPQAKQIRDVIVPEAITVQELAKRMGEKGADLVKSLFNMGSMVTVNQTIDQETAELLVEEFGHNIELVSESDIEIGIEGEEDAPETLKARPPVVTIMGHVDHGKTSLLDALRGTDVVTGEAGGITQHIGAYQVTTKDGNLVTFLDTPGHEAFTEMRQRGANATDIVILVVAADDGLMPQTIEAISHTKAAGVPMIVAINKIDKNGANAQKVRERLLEHEVIVEAMSGEVQDVEVSALKKLNLDDLIEKIALQSELLELKANPDRLAEGVVIEAKLDKGRGPVATILVKRGTLKTGDTFVVGTESGKVRAMVNDKGQQVKEAGPSVPVEVLGLSGVPSAGEVLTAMEDEGRAREVAAFRKDREQTERTTMAPASLENMFSSIGANKAMEYPLIVKADVQGSVQAIVAAVNKISTDDIKARILHAGVGGITESDVILAAASKAPIIGFNVRPNAKAKQIATRDGVRLKYFDVIYHLTDDIRGEMAGVLGPEQIETVVGRAEIKEVFNAGKHGKAAGLMVTEGFIRKALKARITRDDVIIYNGEIENLRRFKDDVAEVKVGLECGVTLLNTTDIKAGDFLETFEVEQRERVL